MTYFLVGNLALCRFYSKHLALRKFYYQHSPCLPFPHLDPKEIKAMEEGIFTNRYSPTE
jgi:hypothetical protein